MHSIESRFAVGPETGNWKMYCLQAFSAGSFTGRGSGLMCPHAQRPRVNKVNMITNIQCYGSSNTTPTSMFAVNLVIF